MKDKLSKDLANLLTILTVQINLGKPAQEKLQILAEQQLQTLTNTSWAVNILAK